MIWTNLLNFIAGLLYPYIYTLPAADTNVVNTIENTSLHFRSYFEVISYVFPVNYFFTLLGFILIIEGILFTLHLLIRFLRLVHILG